MADALTGLRLALALPFAWALRGEDLAAALWAGLILAVAIATDVLDGRLARRAGTVSRYGRAFDHTADVLFVTAGLVALASRGVVPWLLPVLVALAFAQYVVDSYVLHREHDLRMSALGRWNGILYFVPLVGDVLVRTVLGFASALLPLIAWALVATTLLSMTDRLLALRRSRQTARGSPSAGTGGRSPR
jgi:phosphatidylglycerophosphate synthase